MRHAARARPATALVLVLSMLLAVGSQAAEDPFQRWAALRAAAIAEYRHYLEQNGVGDVAPMRALLRSARMWRECDATEFVLPPKALWPNLLPTLRVLDDLRTSGLVDGRRVASGYRDPVLNTCAGGSTRSRHVSNNALDFDLPDSPDNVARLCDYWRSKGPAMKLGLGFYTDTRIHLDTSGFRTWGADHTRQTSLCNLSP